MRRRVPIPTLQGPGDQPFGRPEELAEFLADYFERQFASNVPKNQTFDDQISVEVECCLSLLITTEPEPISREEVADRLVELKPKKTSGPDVVSNIAFFRNE